MEKKSQNILLLALAGIGVYYYLKNKNVTASIVPPTTAELPSPVEKIISPVEPIYQEPIYNERDPKYIETTNNAPRVDVPIESVYQPEPVYNNNVEYGGSVTDFINNQNWLGMLYEKDEPIEYDFEQKRR
jgi:hypothetical protein